MWTIPMRAAVLIVTGLILLGLIFLYVETYNMVPSILPGYPGDAFFPRMVLVFCILWAVIILLRGLLVSGGTARGGEDPTLSLNLLEILVVSVLVLLFAKLLPIVGFEILTVVFMMVLLVPRCYVTDTMQQAVKKSLMLSVGVMLILYLAFGPLLKIALPLAFLPIYF